MKDNEFKSSHLVKRLLDNKCYLSEDEKSLKQKIEESMCDELVLNKISLDSDCHNHFQEIRSLIDLHREKLVEKIDNIYMEMIDRTKAVEASFMKSLNRNQQAFVKSFKQPQSVEKDLEEFETSRLSFENRKCLKEATVE